MIGRPTRATRSRGRRTAPRTTASLEAARPCWEAWSAAAGVARRMALAYRDNGREARYLCSREAVTFGGPRCLSLSAQPVDALVAQLILAALAPSAIAVSLQVAEDVELERAAQHRHWAQRLERARYRVNRIWAGCSG